MNRRIEALGINIIKLGVAAEGVCGAVGIVADIDANKLYNQSQAAYINGFQEEAIQLNTEANAIYSLAGTAWETMLEIGVAPILISSGLYLAAKAEERKILQK